MAAGGRSLGDGLNHPASTFKFPKRKFGLAKPVFRSVQPVWFQKWPWLHYDQVEDRMFCYTCVEAHKQRISMLMCKKKDAFLTVGYTNWKDATGEKNGAFPIHEHSEVGLVALL